eukprot:CAMPEP_0175010354 /NCGR_PEP_ID=MMETSP0005-20121125/8052_1 /TAXON_ID=420556 /ORGANISM="Ochromonas sp., Strain CCMP1393" /LENGTH=105 /DNA_ID=CAMNT_0016266161 /DNA_START=1 /DNA_END=318 /DNA_ORIENTATION=-
MAQLAVVVEKNRNTEVPATSNAEANENMEQKDIGMEQEEEQSVDVYAVAKEYSEAYENGTQFVSCASCVRKKITMLGTPIFKLYINYIHTYPVVPDSLMNNSRTE